MVSSHFPILLSVGEYNDVSPRGGGLGKPYEEGRLFGLLPHGQPLCPDPDLPLGSALGLNSESP